MNMEDLYRLLRTGHVQAQGIVDTIADPMLVLDDGLRVQSASRSFFRTFKVDRDDTIGRPLYELGNGQWDIPELRRLLLEVVPKAVAVINYEVTHDFPDLGRRTMLVTARTLFHPDQATHSMLVVFVDVTEQQRLDAAKDMLFGELRHRMKNLLAVAQSIARHTATTGRTAEEFRDDFLGRFSALVEAEDLAFAEQEQGGIAELLKRVLSPYIRDKRAVEIEPGTAVELGPRTLMSLSIVLHELATNAAKYGALSTPTGQVKISWRLEDDNQLRLEWVESGGPPVSDPTSTGYGTQLIQSTIEYNLGGHVELNYEGGGLKAVIAIPVGGATHPN